jgi:adenylate kinase family enzyme
MKQITCIFFGRSGSGKGTQADLLIKKLSAMDPENRVIYIETGSELRKLKTNGTYTADLIKGVIDNGKLMPASIPILCWSNLMMHEVKTGKEHMVFDGVARRADEAPILSQALEFYGRKDTAVIFLNASNPEVTGRLLKRGRHDDTTDKIAERLKWFETDVMPSVNFFKSQTKCQYIEIDGDQSIEKVHADIVKELGI